MTTFWFAFQHCPHQYAKLPVCRAPTTPVSRVVLVASAELWNTVGAGENVYGLFCARLVPSVRFCGTYFAPPTSTPSLYPEPVVPPVPATLTLMDSITGWSLPPTLMTYLVGNVSIRWVWVRATVVRFACSSFQLHVTSIGDDTPPAGWWFTSMRAA